MVDFSNTPISAIFVYHDPRNWGLDSTNSSIYRFFKLSDPPFSSHLVQVACDVIQSAGIIGGPYKPVEDGQNPVELVFCNPDLLWKSDFDRPRLGQGAFKFAFQAIYKVDIP